MAKKVTANKKVAKRRVKKNVERGQAHIQFHTRLWNPSVK